MECAWFCNSTQCLYPLPAIRLHYLRGLGVRVLNYKA